MSNRPEDGPMIFEDDWCGTFIRGDSSAFYAMQLSLLLKEIENKDKMSSSAIDFSVIPSIKGLKEILESSNMHSEDFSEDGLQKMKKFKECIE